MTSVSMGNALERPAIYLIDSEADILADLSFRIKTTQPALSRLLLGEIDRAEICPAADMPAHIVTMNSHVEFLDETSGVRRSVQLVYPSYADIEAGRISVMTPVGAGLIGLAEGASISWPDRDNHPHILRIDRVRSGALD
jgi:regulator of nucleoside diphosphate kinase